MSVKQELLDNAEAMVRAGGYNNFSFRDLADQVGIKSASVHYHFKTKSDLVVELVQRYTQRFQEQLEQLSASRQQTAAELIYQAFQASLESSGMMCLCGLLAAEGDGLPEEVRLATRDFFLRSQAWLSQQLQQQDQLSATEAETRALALMAILEGAMLLAKVHQDTGLFQRIAGELLRLSQDSAQK